MRNNDRWTYIDSRCDCSAGRGSRKVWGEIERVINMLTINPAKIIGVDNRVGSIEVGKDADIVIFEVLLH